MRWPSSWTRCRRSTRGCTTKSGPSSKPGSNSGTTKPSDGGSHGSRRAKTFFRIDDVVAIHYEVMTDAETEEEQKRLRQERLGPKDRIVDLEKELQLLIDKLRIQTPEFARAIELLNIKFSILKDENPSR